VKKRPPWVGPLVALVIVYVAFALLRPDTFARTSNLVTMARQTAVVGVAAAGMTLVIISGGIDLSVGSMVALTTVAIARLLRAGYGPGTSVLVAIALATAIGALTGAMVARLRITPFIVTLGTMSILRGAAKGFSNEQKIDAVPQGLDTLMALPSPERSFLLFPAGVWIMLVVSALVAGILRYSRFGRHAVAVGSNEATARLAGVRVGAVKASVYALSAALVGLAGVLEFATLTVGDPTDSIGLELEVIAAVVIGGGSLAGGEGSVLGSLMGALLMTVIRSGATSVGLPNWVQEVVTGAIIVIAVWLDRARPR